MSILENVSNNVDCFNIRYYIVNYYIKYVMSSNLILKDKKTLLASDYNLCLPKTPSEKNQLRYSDTKPIPEITKAIKIRLF